MFAALLICCAASELFQALVPAAGPAMRAVSPDGRVAALREGGFGVQVSVARPLRSRAGDPRGTASATCWALPWALSTVAGLVMGALASRKRRVALRRGRVAGATSNARNANRTPVMMSESAADPAVADLDARITGGKSVVMFTADWCKPCKIASPKFREMEDSREYPNVNFVKVDITSEAGQVICKRYGVKSLPTFVYFNDGDTFGSPHRGASALSSLDQGVRDLAHAASPNLLLAGLQA